MSTSTSRPCSQLYGLEQINLELLPSVCFVSGIDTDIGKTYATAYLARDLRAKGINAITQKFIQTGNEGYSEDIVKHRQLMGIELQECDHAALSYPQVFTHPCSPHLAAALDQQEIDFKAIAVARDKLLQDYDMVLQEGAGGLMVPLKKGFLTIDYLKEQQLPLIFVTSARLGSLNHTLLNFKVIKDYGLHMPIVIYNHYCQGYDELIANDTREYILEYLAQNFNATVLLDLK